MPLDPITRRSFLQAGGLIAATGARADPCAPVRFGVITDLHYADRDPAGDRHYRAALGKLEAAVSAFNSEPLDFVIQLGDFIDEGATVEAERENLRRAEAVYARARAPRHYVLGNHCVWSLTRDQFYETVAGRRAPYSFDVRGWHFVVLDACFCADGTPYGAKNFEWSDSEIPVLQRDWLARDLQAAPGPTMVFVHQRLDVDPPYGVRSAGAVRPILASAGKVRAVFQGHHHLNEIKTFDDVRYVTLEAAIEGAEPESNAYGFVTCSSSSIQVEGRMRQASHELTWH